MVKWLNCLRNLEFDNLIRNYPQPESFSISNPEL